MKKDNFTLIGMSNVGKSFWTDELSKAGFNCICCDDEIEKRLSLMLVKLGYKGIEDIAQWMGQPYEDQYPKSQFDYLRTEQRVLEGVLKKLESSSGYVVDTTGSVIYLGQDVIQKLQERSVIVLFDAPEKFQERLYKKYLVNPKPVIWMDQFRPHWDEDPKVSLARCYPELLKSRNRQYRQMADVVIKYEDHHSEEFTVEDLLKRMGYTPQPTTKQSS